MENINNPNEIVSEKDKGDDVQRRFRYQCTFASIISLGMFDPDPKIEEVYCELHEDILLKLISGKFCGIQVKTRENHLGPLELDNNEVKKSVIRFIQHENKFKDKFEFYIIATNVGFSKENNKCIETLIDLAKEGKTAELLKPRSRSKLWIQSIANEANCSENDVICILNKLRLKGNISSMEDISFSLTRKLADILNLKNETYGTLQIISENIILNHIKASSLANNSPLSDYFILSEEPSEDYQKDIINGKKITKESIEDILKRIKEEPITLFIKDNLGIPLLSGVKKLEAKMDAGGISYDNIQLAKDQKYSFETLAASWLHKFDQDDAGKRYNQVKLIVNNECQEIYDEKAKSNELFGNDMLINVRRRLRERYNQEKESFFDCKYDHLLGVTGILTEECKVWWSQKFNI